MKSIKLWHVLVLCLLSAIIGALIIRMVDIPGIKIQKDINPLHALSIVLTLFVAIYISIIFDHKKEALKSIKQVLINRITSVNEIIDSLQIETATGCCEYSRVTSSIKRIFISISCILKICKLSKIEYNDLEEKIKVQSNTVKTLMTETPISASGNVEISVSEGKINYNPSRRSEIETAIEALKNIILDLQYKIICK